MNKIDTILRIGLVAAVLSASSAVTYYYLIHLPNREARLDAERQAQQERIEAAQAAEKAKADQVEQNREAMKVAADYAYSVCTQAAAANYRANWAAACKTNAELVRKRYAACMTTPGMKVFSDANIGTPNAAADCAIPKDSANHWGELLEKGKDRCLQEYQLTLQHQ